MNNNTIGTKFEKYVQGLLRQHGIRAERNIMYHRRKTTCQVDLEHRTGILFPKKKIYECKYVGPGSSFNFIRAYTQLGEAMLFTGAAHGVIVTNTAVSSRKEKEDRYLVQIYDLEFLLELRFGKCKAPVKDRESELEKEIRQTPYSAEDTRFLHRHI